MTVPDIVKQVFGDHPTADFKFELTGDLPQVDVLRAVPRDRLQFRQPPDGRRRHLLLLQAHGRPPHGGRHRFAPASTRRRPATKRSRSSRPSRSFSPELERIHTLGLHARSPAWGLRARRLRPGAPERRAARRRRRCRAATRRATTRSTTTPGTTCRSPTASSMPASGSTSLARSSRPAQAATNARGVCGRVAVHARRPPARRSEPRVSDSVGQLRSGVRRLRGDARRGADRLHVQLRRDVERAAVPAEARDAQAVRPGAADGGGRRPGRRRDLHRQVRPREGAVPLGSVRQEG